MKKFRDLGPSMDLHRSLDITCHHQDEPMAVYIIFRKLVLEAQVG
jgi:hypothetical protein